MEKDNSETSEFVSSMSELNNEPGVKRIKNTASSEGHLFLCGCSKQFTSQELLQAHVDQKHNGSYPHNTTMDFNKVKTTLRCSQDRFGNKVAQITFKEDMPANCFPGGQGSSGFERQLIEFFNRLGVRKNSGKESGDKVSCE